MQNDVKFQASAEAGPEVVRSPVTGEPCVHWRLRIVEHLTARSELVHELASSETFVLAWGQTGARRRPGAHPHRARAVAHRGDAHPVSRGDAGRGSGRARVRLRRRHLGRGGRDSSR